MSLPQPDSVETTLSAVEILKDIKAQITKPPGWSRKSVSPYYRLKFALEVLKVVDAMLLDNEDRVYYYSKFAKLPHRFTSNTLYSYVYQSLRYIKSEKIEGIDKDFYAKVIDRINITREPGVGIRLSFHTAIEASHVDIAPDKVVKKSENKTMKDKIQEWTEKAEVGDKLEITNLGLTPSEVQDIEESLLGTDKFLIADIKPYHIKIRKIA